MKSPKNSSNAELKDNAPKTAKASPTRRADDASGPRENFEKVVESQKHEQSAKTGDDFKAEGSLSSEN